MFRTFIHEWFTSLFSSWHSPTHQSCNMPSADYLSVLCISVFIGAWLFLTHSEERHDEAEKPLQIGQKKSPISRSTICLSNDYLVALWCDTLDWRGSRANILSLTLCISTKLRTTDDTWSGLSCPNTQKYTPSYVLTGKKEVVLFQYVDSKKWRSSSFVINIAVKMGLHPLHYTLPSSENICSIAVMIYVRFL